LFLILQIILILLILIEIIFCFNNYKLLLTIINNKKVKLFNLSLKKLFEIKKSCQMIVKMISNSILENKTNNLETMISMNNTPITIKTTIHQDNIWDTIEMTNKNNTI
jgi:hypothetical protein